MSFRALRYTPFLRSATSTVDSRNYNFILSNFFVNSFPSNAALVTSYADNFTIAKSFPDARCNSQLFPPGTIKWPFGQRRRVSSSLSKTTPTMLYRDTHQARLDPAVTLNVRQFSTDRTPKILWVHWDKMSFSNQSITLPADCTRLAKAHSEDVRRHQLGSAKRLLPIGAFSDPSRHMRRRYGF